MSIPFDPLVTVGFIGSAGAIAFAFVRHQRHGLLSRGLALKDAGHYAESEMVLAKASTPLPLLGFSPAHPEVIEAKLNLLWTLCLQGKDDSCKSVLESLTALLLKDLNLEFSIRILEASGWHHLRNGRMKEAEIAFEEGLQRCLNGSGKLRQSVAYASILCAYGYYMLARSRYQQADSYLKQSQTVLMSAVGAQGIQHLPVLMNSAWLEIYRGDTLEANRVLAHVLKTYGLALGKWHPRCAHILASLGALAGIRGQFDSAEEYLLMADKILSFQTLGGTVHARNIAAALEIIRGLRL